MMLVDVRVKARVLRLFDTLGDVTPSLRKIQFPDTVNARPQTRTVTLTELKKKILTALNKIMAFKGNS